MKNNRQYLNKIWIAGQCKDCGYPVIMTGVATSEQPNDYHIYCSLGICINHDGISVPDLYYEADIPWINWDHFYLSPDNIYNKNAYMADIKDEPALTC